MQNRFCYRMIAADHIAVNDRLHALYDLGMLGKVGQCAVDLRRPDESDCSPGRLNLAASNQRGQSAGGFQYRGCARCVVVCSGLLMAEMTGKDDLLEAKIR